MAVTVSPMTFEALGILAAAIRAGRIQRKMTVRDLAERVGVSAPTIVKLERGDPGVAIGTMFEAATLVGVPLFDDNANLRFQYGERKRTELALLPTAARQRRAVNDDF